MRTQLKHLATAWAALLAWTAAPAAADVVVERWGLAGHVQHKDALTYVQQDDGAVARFDLTSLPKGAKVYRARLLMKRSGGHLDSFTVTAVGADKPLEPAAPYCRWFNVTGPVAASVPTGKAEFRIAGAGYDGEASVLEIAYEGRLDEPPPQVSDVRAFYRAGQVFITFEEIQDLTEGQARYPWGSLIKKTRGYTADGIIPRDDPRELRYRVYRHGEPITPQSIGRAELLAEVLPASGVNTRMVRRIWQGENVPSKLDDAFIAVRHAVRPLEPLPSGRGVYVHTVARPGKAYYAVVAAVNGVENTVDLKGASAGPIAQKPAPPEPVLQAESRSKGPGGEMVTRRYTLWAAPPLSERPMHYRVTIQWYPGRIGKPAPLEVNHGHSHAYSLQRRQRTDAYMLVPEDGPENAFYVGANNCHTTLKSYAQGTWAPWTYRRVARIVEWARSAYDIDDQQIYCYGSHWGMWYLRHPEIYSVFIGWGSAEYTRGFLDWNRAVGCWGPPEAYAGKSDEQNPYVMCDFTRYVQAHPEREMPVQFLVPCTGSHTSEMSYPSLPRYKRALIDARQPFAADIGKASWGFMTPVALREFRAGGLKILRDQSKPAFGNCTLDDNHGNGDIRSGDDKGLINGYLLWRTEDILDEPAMWGATVYLHDSAPLDACGVDITPRHCRRFKPKAGQRFEWTNAETATGRQVESGMAEADKYGRVTLKQVRITKSRHRIVIRRAR